MSSNGSVSASSNQFPASSSNPSPSPPKKSRQKSLVKKIVDLAVVRQNVTDSQMNEYRTILNTARKRQETLSSLEAEFLRTDNNGKRDNNTPLSKKEKKLIEKLKQMGVELPSPPTTYDIRSEKEKSSLEVKHTYQKADDLVRNKSSFFDVAKEIMKMVHRSIFGMIERMNQR